MRARDYTTILGCLCGIFAASLLPVIVVALIYRDDGIRVFAWCSGAAALATVLLLARHRTMTQRPRLRDGFVIVNLLWLVFSLLSAIPLCLLLDIPIADAVFESVSGLTTTGATVLVGLDALPKSLLYYRQQLHWVGGIGVIVSTVAILPMLGIGGMQMLKAEASGPFKDEKLTPRIINTTRYLWKFYAGFTALCALAYWLAGMSVFDAVCHAFATLSTGGFSTHDASFAYFQGNTIKVIAIVFMCIGALPFTVHFLAFTHRSLRAYTANIEIKAFFATILAVGILTAAVLWPAHAGDSLVDVAVLGFFTVVSVITSTGFTIEDFSLWPTLLPALMIYLSCIGGCAGSTAGGIKVIRFVVLFRNAHLHLLRLIHPRLARELILDDRVLPASITDAVWGFFAIYTFVFVVLMLIAVASGLDQVTAFGAVATTLNNMGPGLGTVSLNFAAVDGWMKCVFSFAMLLGRLELFTVMVLLSPAFWID